MNYRAKRRELDPARNAAYKALMDVEENDAYANLALPKILAATRMTGRDRALATEITYGVLRTQGRLDFIINQCSSHSADELDVKLRVLLRMGIYQITEMRVPDHAAVAETVDMARFYMTDGPAKLANAVLRAVTREEPDHWNEVARKLEDPVEAIAIQFSHPCWIVLALEESLRARGRRDLIELLRADNQKPYVTLVARPGLIAQEELADMVEECLDVNVALGVNSPYAVTISAGNPGRITAIRDGRAGVQDEGSQLAGLIFADVATHIEGEESQWLDMCSGPGGKTAMISGLAPTNVQITANEVAAHRAQLVRQAVELRDNVTVVCGDGRDLGAENAGRYDRVLLDAPCSGLGALRRRPEARYRKSPDDLASLIVMQEELLKEAVRVTKTGGLIFYVTCSPHLAETTRIIDAAVQELPVRLIDLSPYAKRFNIDTTDKTIQLWPHVHGTDAMFMAAMIRE